MRPGSNSESSVDLQSDGPRRTETSGLTGLATLGSQRDLLGRCVKEGWLWKKARGQHSGRRVWQKRYAVLLAHDGLPETPPPILHYFRDQRAWVSHQNLATSHFGAVSLDRATCVVAEPSADRHNRYRFDIVQRRHGLRSFAVATEADRKAWQKAVEDAVQAAEYSDSDSDSGSVTSGVSSCSASDWAEGAGGPKVCQLTDLSLGPSTDPAEPMGTQLCVATFNIENGVNLHTLAKRGHLLAALRTCAVIMVQEYDSKCGDVLLSMLNAVKGVRFSIVYCLRVAVLIDENQCAVKSAQKILMTKVPFLSRIEQTYTHIKDRFALHVEVESSCGGKRLSVLAFHLDAVSQHEHPGHHRQQLQSLLADAFGRTKTGVPLPKSYIIAGDTNYRAGEDGSALFRELVKGDVSDQLGLRDVCEGLALVRAPTHRMAEIHEKGVAKRVVRAMARSRRMAHMLGLGRSMSLCLCVRLSQIPQTTHFSKRLSVLLLTCALAL
eukprot:TRINITY_DN13139_c0_g1_i1.p1 TRINITY_DN13139_c0_g1~~TRINITY_DN13139_c0_g1_i1.p1  ORF type:complete len:494 (-),score=43.64 TRINITY_DN13139_c0_g1_i1:298-1779(-)